MKILKTTFLILLVIMFVTKTYAKTTINVAVAANMQYTALLIANEFTKKTGIDVNLSISSSGKLYQQIVNGAPFHVFISADTTFTNKLYEQKLTLQKPKIYATGTLVLWTLYDNIKLNSINSLNNENIKHIAIANPKVAPYGIESINALKYYNLYHKLNNKFVYAESIDGVNQMIDSKSVEIGFTAKSIVISTNLKNKGHWIELPKNSYNPIKQSAALLQYSKKNNLKEATDFYNFLYSKTSKEILKNNGYF